MSNFLAGYGKAKVTPPLGIKITGYFHPRYAETILDDLFVVTCAFEANGERTAIVVADNLHLSRETILDIREAIAKEVDIKAANLFIAATHTHTGPHADVNPERDLEREYYATFRAGCVESVKAAVADLKPATLSIGESVAPRISFVRLYRMKDGSAATNPGVRNPNIVGPVTEPDERVHVVRIDREGAETIVLVNFGTHPDVIGGNNISADWPSFVRTTVERSIDNVKCVFLNGTQGDVNHVNVMPRDGEENGLVNDFDDVMRGYSHSKHMGNVIAGAVLQVYEKTVPVSTNTVKVREIMVSVPANTPDPSEVPLAEKYNELHKAGRDEEIPFKGMALTTEVARAARIVRLKDGPYSFEIPVTAISLGDIAFLGIAGEPFSAIGKAIKDNKSFKLVLPACLTNGSEGYYPTELAYSLGGYEAATSRFKAGVAEIIIEKANELLDSMK